MITLCSLGDGVGVARLRKFSSLMGEEMISGDSSTDEELKLMVELQQNGLTLTLAVLLIGLDDGDEFVDFVIVKMVDYKCRIRDSDDDGVIWKCSKSD